MDCSCPIKMCEKKVTCKFGSSQIKIGLLPTQKTRLVLCVQEKGIEPQHIVIALAGVMALIEAAASFVRVCL
jgi:hypothetical protein